MVDYHAARSTAQKTLAAMEPAFADDSWIVLEEHTAEYGWGWVFYFDSRLHHETGDFRYTIAGNAPLIVRRRDGAVLTTSTCYPVEHFIAEYEKSGHLP